MNRKNEIPNEFEDFEENKIEFELPDKEDMGIDVSEMECVRGGRVPIISYESIKGLGIIVEEIKEKIIIVRGLKTDKKYGIFICKSLEDLEVGGRYVLQYNGKRKYKRKYVHNFTIWRFRG